MQSREARKSPVLHLRRARIREGVGHPHCFNSGDQLDCCPRELNGVATGEFFQNTATRTRIVDHRAVQNLLSEKSLPHFKFYTKEDKILKAVIRLSPGNNYP
jgi:hypothetical protein